MRIRAKSVALGLLVLILLAANLQLAEAHRWKEWHWNKTTIKVKNTAVFHAAAEAAINDWASHTELKMPRRTTHTDISVYDGNWGLTGWAGLASIKDTGWDWWCWWWCEVEHGHARYNSHYAATGGTGSNSRIRGIFCEELGHLFGLRHFNTGCMGPSNSPNVTTLHLRGNVNNYTH